MAFYKLLIFMVCAAVTQCEDCIFDMKHKEKELQFDLTSFKELQTVNFNKSLDSYSINIKLCKSKEQESTFCDGIKSKLCLIKNNKTEYDIGSKIKEVKLDVKNQLIISLEGNSICEKNKKYTTDITFICNKNITENNIIYKPGVDGCKFIIELTSANGCPVDDLDIRSVCKRSIELSHNLYYKFNLNPLRRLTNNYLVENQNHRFEINICGRLTDNNKCNKYGSNITTVCDITNATNPKVFAVGTKDDILFFDAESRSLNLIQRQKANTLKGRRAKFIFSCDENIPPEETKVEYIYKHNEQNVAYFNITTSLACIPRMTLCEIFTADSHFDLKPLHKRVGNFKVINEKEGGYFYLNVCGYLNEYGEKIPTSCTAGGKTSVCYVDISDKGIPIGSTQIGPYYIGNSLLLNYTDGIICKNTLKWKTIINFICSDESQIIHDSTNFTSCTYVFIWKSRKACPILFERKNQCMVTHPYSSTTVYNISHLKYQSFEAKDYENDAQFQFNICSPLHTPCNGHLDSAACWKINGIEKNIGLFTEQVVFDNGKIYMSMEGEKCVDNGPNSYTTIRFICDYLDSKSIDFKQDLHACTFEFIIYTKHVCTPASKNNCTVDDHSGNIYDLSKLTKFDSNYEISISQKKKIILNVCHSVINTGYTMDNDVDGINCEFTSGVCLVDSNNLFTSDWYKNLGEVNYPHKKGNKIILEMMVVFYNNNKVSSIIEFVCSNETTNGPVLNEENQNMYMFQWLTPLVCPTHGRKQKNEIMTHNNNAINPTYQVSIHGLNYSIYLCPKNYTVPNGLIGTSKPGRNIILTINERKIMKTLTLKSYYVHETNTICAGRTNNETIMFKFMCGFELQKPIKIKNENNKSCITNVLNIDPEICSKKLECRVNLYDLTPIKGNHIVYDENTTYYINMCLPGNKGVGGIMESNGKNYTIGYQVDSPKNVAKDIVEVTFTDGDNCDNNLMKYSTKIVLECNDTEALGKPKFMKTNEQCELHFSWKTSLVCNKLIKFDKSTCTAIVNEYFNIIDMKEMASIINNFLVNSTILYRIDFCNESICIESKCFGSMSLQYNIYKKQFIASFKNDDDHTKVDIIIKCSKLTRDLPEVISINGGEIVSMHLEHVCCMDNIDLINKEMCKKYLLSPISTIPLNAMENAQYNTNRYIGITTNSKEIILQSSGKQFKEHLKTAIEKPNMSIKNMNITVQHDGKAVFFVNVTDMPIIEKDYSGTLFYSGIIILIGLVLFLAWIFRWKLLREMRILFYSSPLNRSKQINYQRDCSL